RPRLPIAQKRQSMKWPRSNQFHTFSNTAPEAGRDTTPLMATTRGTRGPYHCSFCGKSQDQVRRLIAGPGSVYICDECVELCREIIDEESAPPARAKVPMAKLPTPRKIHEQLNQYVVGQEL